MMGAGGTAAVVEGNEGGWVLGLYSSSLVEVLARSGDRLDRGFDGGDGGAAGMAAD